MDIKEIVKQSETFVDNYPLSSDNMGGRSYRVMLHAVMTMARESGAIRTDEDHDILLSLLVKSDMDAQRIGWETALKNNEVAS